MVAFLAAFSLSGERYTTVGVPPLVAQLDTSTHTEVVLRRITEIFWQTRELLLCATSSQQKVTHQRRIFVTICPVAMVYATVYW